MTLRKIAIQNELTANNPQQILFAEDLATTTPLYPPNSTRQEIEHKFKNSYTRRIKIRLCDLIRRK